MKDLIKSCFKKEPLAISRNMKDSHLNVIGADFVLLSVNKNAHVVSRFGGKVFSELNLKNREMSCSMIYQDVLLIGTYVDTLFVFQIPSFQLLFSIRARDSILTMCVVSEAHNFIALGQAGGYVDILKL